MLRKCLFLTGCLIWLIFSGHALEITCTELVPFADNGILIQCDQPGELTVQVHLGNESFADVCTSLWVDEGQTTLMYNALSWNSEPLPSGTATLTARHTDAKGVSSQAQIQCTIARPLPAVTYCVTNRTNTEPGAKPGIRIECGLSNTGRLHVGIFDPLQPDQPLWQKTLSLEVRDVGIAYWNGTDHSGHMLPEGEYILRAWCNRTPHIVIEKTLQLYPALSEEPLKETGPLLPLDPQKDASVWEALSRSVVVLNGGEGKGGVIYTKKSCHSPKAGIIQCRTAGLQVLDLSDDEWALVGAWRQSDGAYVEGYVEKSQLRVIPPNLQYGVLIDKSRQIMRIYENGSCIGEVQISTGLVTGKTPRAETQAGVYLTAGRQYSFPDADHYQYLYAIRIDGGNLIHQMGYHPRKGGVRDFADQLATLGQKASHGCIRVDFRLTEASGGINAYWLWTHLGPDTKVIILE